MKKILCLMVVTSLALGFFVSPAEAQERQLLEYRSAREASRTIGSLSRKPLTAIHERPQDVELPEFESREPLFYLWSTPMVKAGSLRIALDRSDTSKVRDRLFIDSDGDGSLKDETAVIAHKTSSQHASFGPVKVVFEGEDGSITYHLNFSLCDHGRRLLYITPGGWYEGTITVGEKERHCILIDRNVNGTFNDKSMNAEDCDRIQIGKDDNKGTRFVGNYLEIEGDLHHLEVARDGAYVKLTAAEDVTFGNVKMPESITEFAAGGENGLFVSKPEDGVCSLPVGQYLIDHWTTERKDDAGNRWKLQGSSFSESGRFSVSEAEEVKLSIGEPVISTLTTRDRRGNRSFSQSLAGKLKESINITRSGKRGPAPTLHIKSKDGTYDKTFAFKYG
ncbi:MAG: hypothetical protein ACYSWZ_02890 [Planctomycetota bacterium]|jgi:hypothetical protein